MKINKFISTLSVLAAALLALSSCGGGGGGGGSSTTTTTPSTPTVSSVSPIVMDGLLQGATVCVDTNNNGVCDTGEVTSAATGTDGKATLTPANSTDLSTYKLVATVPGTAVDQDRPGTTMGTAYTMTTPIGNNNTISMLTTMAQQAIDSHTALSIAASTAADADTWIKGQTGLKVSVYDNYVAQRGASADYMKASDLARLLTASLQASLISCTTTYATPHDREVYVRTELLKRLNSQVSAGLAAVNAQTTDANKWTAVDANKVVIETCQQTITFNNPGTQTVGTTATLSASTVSGLPITFASTTPTVCTVSGTTLTPVAAGNCTITANQVGGGAYGPATQVSQTVTVNSPALKSQTITFNNPGTQTVGTNATLSATASSGLTVAFTSATGSVCSISGTTLTPITAGTCTVNANQAGNGSYNPATQVQQSFTINPAPKTAQTISFTPPTAVTPGTTTTLSATASSGLAVSFTSSTSTVCTISGTTLSALVPGTCTINANQAGNATYSAAPTVTKNITVNPQTAQTITFTALSAPTVGTNVTLSATATSGLAVSFASTTPTFCTVSGTTLTPVAAGTCTVTASQAGNATYAAATPVSQTVTVGAAPKTAQTITFAAPAAGSVALSATASSGLIVSFTTTTPTICSVGTATLSKGVTSAAISPLATGTCTVTANQAGNTTYAAATPVTQNVTMTATLLSAASGKVLFQTTFNCDSCHGYPPSQNKILNGANNTSIISAAINGGVGAMAQFQGQLSAQNLADIAAFLATPSIW